ncbi:MAG: hypothetical protein IJD38_09220 [Clostridia bacterium]|nr:hypothetical protein [Clostridia bacterium]
MNNSILIALPLALFVIVSGVIAMLKARKRSWIMAVVRLAITVVTAAVALPLTSVGVSAGADAAYDLLIPYLPEDIMAFLNEVPVGAEGLRVLAGLILAPFVYLLVFIILRWILYVIAWIVEKCVPLMRRRNRRYVSLPVGALNGMIFAMVTLIPVCGFMMLGTHMFRTFLETDIAQSGMVREILEPLGMTEEDLDGAIADIEENFVVVAVYETVGKPVFTNLTTATLDVSETHGTEVKINLESELCGLLKTAGYAMEVMESFEKEDYTAEDKELLFAMADTFFESDWVRMLSADTLAAMAGDWLEGKDFAGMERPSPDANLDPTLNRILELLAAETSVTLEQDIHDVLDVVGDLLVHDLLGGNTDYDVMVQRMGQSGLLTTVLSKLETNPRMAPLAAELKALAIRLVTNMLGVDQLKNGEYSEMMTSVAGTLTNSLSMSREERDALVLDSIRNNFGDQGFDVPDDVALQMANQMIDELGEDGEISSDELTNYLINHVDEGFEYIPEELPEGLPDVVG